VSRNKRKKKRKHRVAVLILTAVFVIMSFNAIVFGLQTAYPKSYSDIVEANASEYGLDSDLLYALIETESGFNKDAVSNVGAMGLTQILPETFQWLQTKTGETLPDNALFEPEVSVKYGAYLLRYLIDEFGDVSTAIAAYHAGITKVHSWLESEEYSDDGSTLKYIPYDDTRGYVEKVLFNQKMYTYLYSEVLNYGNS
jgi:soluble lytic murein transglycosylase